MTVLKFVAHSYRVLKIANRFGWLPAARYTNLRDVRRFDRLGFLDIDWKDYKFEQHLRAARDTKPLITVARDVEKMRNLPAILDEAFELLQHATHVVIVPKDVKLENELEHVIPPVFLLGYSVPTCYGGTKLSISAFKRPIHLLGGRPDVQRKLAEKANVFSIDCNRFTLDAAFGDYFDGNLFRPHPRGGYEQCIRDSLRNMNRIWRSYPNHKRTNR
jgi:hypothetical protein